MKKKLKLFMTVASLCLALATLCFGVFSAVNITYTIGGTISYEVNDVFADVKTRVYTSDFKDKTTLSTKVSTLAESGDVTDLADTLYTYDFSTDGDSQSFDNTEGGTKEGVKIEYNTTDKRTYFVVVSIKNRADNTISANISGKGLSSGANTVFAKSNAVASLTNKEEEKRLVMAFMLDDITTGTNGAVDFAYTISIDNGALAQTYATLQYLNNDATFSLNKEDKIATQAYIATILADDAHCNIDSGIAYYGYNFNLSNIDLDSTISATIEILNFSQGIQGCYILNKQYKSVLEAFSDENLESYIIGVYSNSVSVPASVKFSNNEYNFCVVIVVNSEGQFSFDVKVSFEQKPEYDEYFKYSLKDDNTYKISAKDNTTLSGDVVIPDEFNGKPVTEIESVSSLATFKLSQDAEESYDARQISYIHSNNYKTDGQFSISSNYGFLMCDIKTLTIGKNIEIIGQYAFASNTGLTTLKFKEGSKLKEIGDYAFFSCVGLTDMQSLPEGLEKIGERAFSDCSISHINIPSSVNSIALDFIEQNFYFGYPNSFRTNNNVNINISISEQNQTYACVDNIIYSKDMKTLYIYFQNNGLVKDFVVPETVETIAYGAFFYNDYDPVLFGSITFTKNIKNIDLAQFCDGSKYGSIMCNGDIIIESKYILDQLNSNSNYKFNTLSPFDVQVIKILKSIDTETTNSFFDITDESYKVVKDTKSDEKYNIYKLENI